jgi:hypothetical protein
MTTLLRGNVEWLKARFHERLGNDYVYAGIWSPTVLGQGCDCSALVAHCLNGVLYGPNMAWQRIDPASGAWITTESWRPINPGQVGPFGTIDAASPNDIPTDAPVKIALHHGPGGGANSHMNCIVDGTYMESNGTVGCCTMGNGARPITDSYWNDWAFLPGSISGGAAPPAPAPAAPSDTIFADVSEFQVPVDDSYTAASYTAGNGVSARYSVLSIRSNDGGHRDLHFARNYRWCVQACDAGLLHFFIVYFYWRPGATDVDTHMAMVREQGGPHPRMVSMMDVESGGNPGGDQSAELNAEYNRLAGWLGDQRRVIGYANVGDERTMWQFKPDHLPLILAGYGGNPSDDTVFKIAHQYTDGRGFGGGLPEGVDPFGACDMNAADGFSPAQLGAALGIDTEEDPLAGVDVDRLNQAVDKILGGGGMPAAWLGRGMFAPADEPQKGVDDTVGMLLNTDGNSWNVVMIVGALLGVERDVQAIKDNAAGRFPDGMYAAENAWLKARAQEFAQKLQPLCGSLGPALQPLKITATSSSSSKKGKS